MKLPKSDRELGFSLIEVLAAMAIGLVVVGSATELFKVALDATALVTQRAEMQQNARTAMNLIAKDISMAGAGLPTGGVQLPSGGGSTLSLYGRDAVVGCYLQTCTYPGGNRMYGIIPGDANGKSSNVVPATGLVGDSITSVYVDYAFPLNQYAVTFPAPQDGTVITLTAPVPAVTAIDDPAVGITVGDLILLSNNFGTAVGEVTGRTAASISFADLDPLNINQSAAPTGRIAVIANGTNTVAYRLWAVTYFLEVPNGGQLPRLMRQVSGHPAVPVADNILNVQFSYDLYDEGASLTTPNQSVPPDLNQIRKVNIWLMGQSLKQQGGKSQNMELVTSVSTRNLSFHDRYN